ncbi:MAG: hypothetical protein ACLUT2_08475, partial [Clostridium sp.]
ESLAGGAIGVNRTEGKIQINNTTVLFSSIRGAEMNMMTGCRVVTRESSKTKSKKHASLGGAVAGGMLFGPLGAAVGAVGLGEMDGKTIGTTVSDQIPTCTHLGVMVNIDGFMSEVVLLSNQVDQTSAAFVNARNEAQSIIAQLGKLAKMPVPSHFLQPEEEQSVKEIEAQIAAKQSELQIAINDRPTYDIPAMYRTPEQRGMSDEQYLQYLNNTDAQRMSQSAAYEDALKGTQAEQKAVWQTKSEAERAERNAHIEQRVDNAGYLSTLSSVATLIYNIIFWFLSVFVLLFAIAGFANAGIVSGIIYLITAIMINPLVGDHIRDKGAAFPKWAVIIILIVGFLAGALTFPITDTSSNKTASIERVNF